jgi:hypothetical protein
METRCDQLLYTSARAGTLGQAGFQTVACSSGIGAGEKNEIERFLYYPKPDGLRDDLDEEQIRARCPENFGFATLSDGRTLLFLSRYLGRDYSGRAGNFLGHGILLDAGSAPIRPAWLAGWNRFLCEATEIVARVEAGAPPVLDEFLVDDWSRENVVEAEKLAKFLAVPEHAERLAAIVEALLQVKATGRRILLHLPQEDAKYYLAGVHAGLPPAWVGIATFSTFAPDARSSQAAITIIPSGDGICAPGAAQRDYEFFVFASQAGDSSAIPTISGAASRVARHAVSGDGWPRGFEVWASNFKPPRDAAGCDASVALFNWLQTGESGSAADALAFLKEHAREGVFEVIFAPVIENPRRYLDKLSLQDLKVLDELLATMLTAEERVVMAPTRRSVRAAIFRSRFEQCPEEIECGPSLGSVQAGELLRFITAQGDHATLKAAISDSTLSPERRRAQLSILLAVATCKEVAGSAEPVFDLIRAGFATLATLPAETGPLLEAHQNAWTAKILELLFDSQEWNTRAMASACVAAYGDRAVDTILEVASAAKGLGAHADFQSLVEDCSMQILAPMTGNAAEKRFAQLLASVGRSALPNSEQLAAGVFARHIEARADGDTAIHGCLIYLLQKRSKPLDPKALERVIMLLEEKIDPANLSTHLSDSNLVKVQRLRSETTLKRVPDRFLLLSAAALARKARRPLEPIRKLMPLSEHLAALDEGWWRLVTRKLLDATVPRLRSDEDFNLLIVIFGEQVENRCASVSKELVQRVRPAPAIIGTAPGRFSRLLNFQIRHSHLLSRRWTRPLWSELRSAMGEFSTAQRRQLMHYARYNDELLMEIHAELDKCPAAPGVFKRTWQALDQLRRRKD